MSRRKGELTRAGIDRQWPHQVALKAPLGERYPEMIAFCRERSAAPRHPGFWRDDAGSALPSASRRTQRLSGIVLAGS
jgi:hypothetical protein